MFLPVLSSCAARSNTLCLQLRALACASGITQLAQQQHACCAPHDQQHSRTFSAAAAAQPLTLKTALRQLYKRVHPDLFADYPAEQASARHTMGSPQQAAHVPTPLPILLVFVLCVLTLTGWLCVYAG
jgi:hypothetical protein